MGHQERLTVPWWGWLLTLVVVVGFTAPFWFGALRWVAFVAPVAAAVGLWWLGRIRVAVVDGELIVDDARLPVRFVADAVALDAAGRSELLGPAADPLAFVVQRPWIGGAVQVVLDDPADPTPYWLVSTRHPDRLASALLSAAGPLPPPPVPAHPEAARQAPPPEPARPDQSGAGHPGNGSTSG
jgi:Protein of unknown function (DUF3093)